jgi:hypothetical protein
VSRIVRRDRPLRTQIEARAAALGRRVASLDHAVARVGLAEFWRFSMLDGLCSSAFAVRGWQSQADRMRARAYVAARVGDEVDGSGTAFAAGLTHCLGMLPAYRCAASSRADRQPSARVVEQVAWRHQATIGALMVHDWALPAEVGTAVARWPGEHGVGPRRCRLTLHTRAFAIAALGVQEAREGRDVGTPARLALVPGLPCSPRKMVLAAAEAFDQWSARRAAAA